MTPRAVIFDLDGTLTVSKTPVRNEMGTLLTELLEHMPVAVMSGGSWKQFETQLLSAFPYGARFERLYLFPVSAAECRQYENGVWKTVYSHAFSDADRTRVMNALRESLAESGLSDEPAHVWGARIEDRGAQITFSGLGQDAPPEEKKRWDPDKKKRDPLVKALKARLPGFSVRANAASSVDITREGITKAYGVEEFSKMLEVPADQMLYVGDGLFPGGNDAVVYEACMDLCVTTRRVSGPEETATVIEGLIA